MTINSQKTEHHFTLNDGGGADAKAIERSLRFDNAGTLIGDEDSLRFITIRPGFFMFVIRTDPKVMSSYHFDIQSRFINFSFVLGGKLGITYEKGQGKKSQEFVSQWGTNTLALFQHMVGHSRCLSDETLHSVTLLIEREVLEMYLAEGISKIPDFFRGFLGEETNLSTLPMTAQMHWTASRAANHGYHGVTAQLYLEGIALELLALQIDRLTQNAFLAPVSLKKSDVDRIQAAAQMLIRDMTNPPTIAILARQVGINESKLKKGFKQIFGITVFQFLLRHRMNCAKKMIVDQGIDVTQAASRVGYTNISHFISCYNKTFSVTPGYHKRNPTS